MEDTYGLRKYFEIVWKQKIIIIAVTLAIMAVGALFAFFLIRPVYEASTSLMINRVENDAEIYIDIDNVVLNQKLVNTYGKIATSDAVLKKTIANLNIDTDAEELRKSVTVTIYADTEIIEISVLNENPNEAAKIANDMAGSFIEEIKRIMEMENVKVIDIAEVPQSPAKPNRLLIMIVTGFIGIMLGLLAAFSREYLDDKIKTPKDVERELGIQILGVVPIYKKQKRRGHDV